MRQLFIPTIGTTYTLAEDWTFTVINDRRNETIVRWAGKYANDGFGYPLGKSPVHYWMPSQNTIDVTLPKGTLLKVDRIYIRKNLKDFDSLTFTAPDLKAQTHGGQYRLRFFAKLDDVNRMVVE